jgi:PIN domain-containing protein
LKDKDKGGADQYGDAILWVQTLEYAKKKKTPILLTTDDRKEDWWQRIGGKTVGPRPELRQEMAEYAQVDFYLYRPDQFLEYASKFLKQDAPKKAVAEVRNVQQLDEAAMRAAARQRVCGEAI